MPFWIRGGICRKWTEITRSKCSAFVFLWNGGSRIHLWISSTDIMFTNTHSLPKSYRFSLIPNEKLLNENRLFWFDTKSELLLHERFQPFTIWWRWDLYLENLFILNFITQHGIRNGITIRFFSSRNLTFVRFSFEIFFLPH